MRENGKQLRFVYQNGELLYEEGGDKETASCHLGAGIEAVRRGQKTYYYHPDEQLSTALITDETGTIKNQYRYDAFGAGLEVSEELPNRIRYTGQQYDGVTEQYYLRARYYNPILGRFLQEDVCQGDGLNLYAYCRNNPVVYYDPSGYSNTKVNASGCTGDGKFGDDNKEVNDLIKKIPSKYKDYGQCNNFARALQRKLNKAGIDYEMYRVDPIGNWPGIISKKMKDQFIGFYHYGIKIGDKIYDNLDPKGVDYNFWKDDLNIGELAHHRPVLEVEDD